MMRINFEEDSYILVENDTIIGRRGKVINGGLYRELSKEHQKLFVKNVPVPEDDEDDDLIIDLSRFDVHLDEGGEIDDPEEDIGF